MKSSPEYVEFICVTSLLPTVNMSPGCFNGVSKLPVTEFSLSVAPFMVNFKLLLDCFTNESHILEFI